MINVKNILRGLALALCLASLCGCAGSGEPPRSNDYVSPSPSSEVYVPPNDEEPTPVSGELTLSMRVPKTLNPLLNEDATVDGILSLIFEPIMRLDDKWRPTSCLAESVVMAEDGLSAVIVLRGDARWADGQPITADDVQFSLDVLKNQAKDGAIYKHVVDDIALCERIDPLTARVSFTRPSGTAKYSLCFPVIPKHFYQNAVLPDDDTNMYPLGSGSYYMDEYVPAKRMTLSPNTYSFREQPLIDDVSVLITPDHETDLYAFNESVIDAVSATIAEWGRYRVSKTANIAEYPGDDYDFIGFNMDSPLWADKRVRGAVARAVSVNDIVESVYLNHADKTATPINPACWLYEPGAAAYDFDLERAAKLLAESGFSQDGPFTIIVNEENAERVKIADILRENLAKLGMDCYVVRMPFDEYAKALDDGRFGLVVGGFAMGVVPDLSFAFRSDSTPESGGLNVFRYSNATLDALLDQAAAAPSDTAYAGYMSEAQRIISDELPCVSLVFRKGALLTDSSVSGVKPNAANCYDDINQWFITEPALGG